MPKFYVTQINLDIIYNSMLASFCDYAIFINIIIITVNIITLNKKYRIKKINEYFKVYVY